MTLSDEMTAIERAALLAAQRVAPYQGSVQGRDEAIWLAGKAYGLELAAKICEGEQTRLSQAYDGACRNCAYEIRSRIKGAD